MSRASAFEDLSIGKTPPPSRELSGTAVSSVEDVFSEFRNPGRPLRPLSLPDRIRMALPSDLQPVPLSEPASASDDTRDIQESMTVDGKHRRFEIHLPKGYDGHGKLRVIYMMPGYKESLETMRQETGMNKLADERGFAVVYMEALKQPMPWPFGSSEAFTWNLDHGTLTPKDPSYDDLTYIKDVDKALSSQLNVDGRGKYLAGFSEGALAAQYVAQQMKGTFAGVALVHGTLLEDDPRPAVGDPTATIVVLGNDDNMFALNGGHGWFQGGSLIKGFMSLNFGKVSKSRPLQQTQAWAQANRCSDPKTVDTKHNTITTYSCQDAPVKQIIRKSHIHNWWYQGGMHAWDGPGQDVHAKYGWPVVGEPDRTEDTSRQIVDFLFQYEKSE